MCSKKNHESLEINEFTAKAASKTWLANVTSMFVHRTRHVIQIKQLGFL